jgi:hypothetical protein
MAHSEADDNQQQETEAILVPPPEPPLAFTPDGGDFTAEHAQVFSALAAVQEASLGQGVHLDELAETASLPADRLQDRLRELTVTFRLVNELPPGDGADPGPRYEVKPRL